MNRAAAIIALLIAVLTTGCNGIGQQSTARIVIGLSQGELARREFEDRERQVQQAREADERRRREEQERLADEERRNREIKEAQHHAKLRAIRLRAEEEEQQRLEAERIERRRQQETQEAEHQARLRAIRESAKAQPQLPVGEATRAHSASIPSTETSQSHIAPSVAHRSSDMKLPGECSGRVEAISRVRLIFDAENRVKERCYDENADGRYDEIIYYDAEGEPVLEHEDDNFDGHLETETHFSNRRPTRQRKDASGDGRWDQWATFEDNRIEQRDDLNSDGRVDSTTWYMDELPVRSEVDSDFDGKIDRILTYEGGEPVSIVEDRDEDGNPEYQARYSTQGAKISEKQDIDDNGKPEVLVTYRKGKKHRIKEDTNRDGRWNLETVYTKDGSIKQRHADTTGDGRFDTTSDYQGGAERRQARDLNQDGTPDRLVLFLPDGSKEREDFDEDNDGKVELVRFFKEGKRVREQEDTTKDGNLDLETWFEKDKRVRARADTNSDGDYDNYAYYNAKEHLIKQEEDQNHDGDVDTIFFYEETSDKVRRAERDLDFNGSFETVTKSGSPPLRQFPKASGDGNLTGLRRSDPKGDACFSHPEAVEYINRVKNDVYSRWHANNLSGSHQVTLRFQIGTSGTAKFIEVVEGNSSTSSLPMEQALRNASPFAPMQGIARCLSREALLLTFTRDSVD